MHPETPLYPPTSSSAPTLLINPPRTKPMAMIPTPGLYTEHHYPPTSSSSNPLGPPVGIDTLQPDADVPDEHHPHQPSPLRGRPQRARRAPTYGTGGHKIGHNGSSMHDDEPKDDASQPPPPPKHYTRVIDMEYELYELRAQILVKCSFSVNLEKEKVASTLVQELLHKPPEHEVADDGNMVVIGDGINNLVGVEKMHKDSKYVKFLDDDVRLHPGSIGALIAAMEKNPDIFIQTGYPLDLPSGSSCIYEYHMMHADDFRLDRYGVVSGLQDGGYSDDMTLAAIAGVHKRLITSPPVAVFPHPLSSDLSFSRYWNYLRKQTFVLESYTTNVVYIMNRALFTSHCYLSWGFVAPYIMSMFHITAALRIYIKRYSFEETSFTSGGEHTTFPQIHLSIEKEGDIFKALKHDLAKHPVEAFRDEVTRMDWALEQMRQFGFCDQLVRETVKELLKVGFYLFVFVFAKSKDIHGIQSYLT
ncbi:hypothetical protein SO802_026501 [Lithocarpus litseifolius]|uniref:ceramide glucosyltransferase n=1 Tax=Lithocarpus litseifolius TaxID=425828 RepID=A0AAW2BZU5_9ROSI